MFKKKKMKNILILAPHPDDESVGLSVFIKRKKEEGCKIRPCHENLCFAHWVESHKDDPDFKIKRHALIKQKACINDFIPTFVEELNVNYTIEKTVHFEGKQRRLDCEMYDDEITIDMECDEYQHKYKRLQWE